MQRHTMDGKLTSKQKILAFIIGCMGLLFFFGFCTLCSSIASIGSNNNSKSDTTTVSQEDSDNAEVDNDLENKDDNLKDNHQSQVSESVTNCLSYTPYEYKLFDSVDLVKHGTDNLLNEQIFILTNYTPDDSNVAQRIMATVLQLSPSPCVIPSRISFTLSEKSARLIYDEYKDGYIFTEEDKKLLEKEYIAHYAGNYHLNDDVAWYRLIIYPYDENKLNVWELAGTQDTTNPLIDEICK